MIAGLTITIVGMSVVFLFLTILVLAMNFFSYLIRTFFPEKEEVIKVRSRGSQENEVAAAIAAAYAAIKKN